MKALALNVCHVERSWLKFEEDWNQKHPLYDLSKVDVFVQNPMEEFSKYSSSISIHLYVKVATFEGM